MFYEVAVEHKMKTPMYSSGKNRVEEYISKINRLIQKNVSFKHFSYKYNE